MKTFFCLLAALWFVGTITSDVSAQEFRWNLLADQNLQVILDQSSETETVCQTIRRVTRNHVILSLSWHVQKVDGNVATIQQTIDRIQLEINQPTEDGANRIDFDTAEPRTKVREGVEKEVQRDLNAMIGLQIIVEMNNRGTIEKVQLSPESEKVINGLGSSIPLAQSMTPQGITELFQDTMFTFPEETIQAGQTWKTERLSNGPFGKLTVENQFKYSGETTELGKTVARFEIKSQIRPPEQPTPPTHPGDPPPQLLSTTTEGAFLFDPAMGVFQSASVKTVATTEKRYRDLLIQTKITGTSDASFTLK